MTDYKETLNLPNTKFPMKASLPTREPGMLKQWQDSNVYQKIREVSQGRDKYIMHDGPPYANGKIHVGHAINKILKDIVVRSQTLNGFDVPYIPGWDCHGLPIELNVEKKHGKPGQKISENEYRGKCREYAKTQIAIQSESFQRLGALGDWGNPYLTMNFNYEADIIRALAKIVENGHVIQGFKPVHWCLNCGSSLAEAEVEYKDKQSLSIDVAFAVADIADFNQRAGVSVDSAIIPIWTTTAWTLPANQAVALNAELEYEVYETSKGVIVLAKELAESALQRYGLEGKVIATIKGEVLEKLQLKHPFYDKHVPVILGEHVTTETGTGAVHTAPGHGQEDFEVAKEYGLEVINPVAGNGVYVDGTELVAGEHISKAADKLIEVMQQRGVLLHQQKFEHSYPHCWRHKTPLIFRATPQWFISMDANGLREAAIKEIEKIDWIPDWGYNRIKSMIENRPDWCVSRQRFWGTPMSLFIHKQTGELHPNAVALMHNVAEKVEQGGVEAWYATSDEEFLGEDANDYERINDTLDVWFDSGVSHFCVMDRRDELQRPSNLYLEGSDQHRGWFQSSLLTSVAMYGESCYKAALTHGFTIDKDGRKMSKSIGNVIEPEKVINTLGADVLRLWVSSVDYTSEMVVSDENLKQAGDAYRRLRNTAKFLLSNLHDFESSEHLVAAEQLLPLDKWAINKVIQLQQQVTEAYNSYNFHVAFQKLFHFCSIEMGSFYLDIIKDRQYTVAKNNVARRSAQTAMYHIIETLTRLFAPILAFTAEEIWQCLPGEREESVLLKQWYQCPEVNNAEFDEAFWQQVIAVRTAVNKELESKRADGDIRSGLEAEVSLYCQPELKAQLEKLGNELRFILITSSATLDDEANKGKASDTEVDGLWVSVVASQHEKCERCWHRVASVGQDADHPTICTRCVENLAEGEVRQYA